MTLRVAMDDLQRDTLNALVLAGALECDLLERVAMLPDVPAALRVACNATALAWKQALGLARRAGVSPR